MALPPAVKRLHEGGAFAGEAPEGLPARSAAWMAGFPAGSALVAARVCLTPDGNAESRVRDFGGRRFRSRMVLVGQGLEERFGLLALDVAVPAVAKRLRVVVRGWCCPALPLAPFGLGRIMRYRGRLAPA